MSRFGIKKYVKLFKKIKLEFFRISMKLEHEFFYIFKKSFCKNIRRFENFTLLTSIRRGPRRFGCRRGLRSATDGGMKRPSNRRGPQRLVF
jgi:hypothetical protein